MFSLLNAKEKKCSAGSLLQTSANLTIRMRVPYEYTHMRRHLIDFHVLKTESEGGLKA